MFLCSTKQCPAASRYNGVVNMSAGSPAPRDSPYDTFEALQPPPPPRALELVKQEVHRALQAFSTRPLKGESQPPLPSHLLRPFDVSRDGRVTYSEFKAGLRGLGLGLAAHEVQGLARDIDDKGIGLVDRERFEFLATEDWGRGTGAVESSAAETQQPNLNIVRRERHVQPLNCQDVLAHSSVREEECRNIDDNMMRKEGQPDKRHGALHTVVTNTAPHRGGSEPNSYRDGAGGKKLYSKTEVSVEEEDLLANRQRLPPPPPSVMQKAKSSTLPSSGKPRSPTVSFDRWFLLTAGGDIDEGVVASNCSNSGRQTPTSVTNNHTKTKIIQRSLQKRMHALNTLRSLLKEGGWDDTASVFSANGHHRSFDARERGGDYQSKHHRPGELAVSNVTARGFFGEITGVCGEQQAGVDRGRSLHRKEIRGPRRNSTSTGTRIRGRQGEKTIMRHTDSKAESRHELKKICRDGLRAETIIRLRSRGDLVGLRKALSRADPSASGVVSQREMERVILRRFGAGLGEDEARALSLRFRKEIGGRGMVDYVRLVDHLDATEAGLLGRVAVDWERQRCQKERNKPRNSIHPKITLPAAAGTRSRKTHRKYSRKVHKGTGGDSLREIPAEESQLVRRARAKALALLDEHGTRSVDHVFGLVDLGGWFGR